MWWLHDALQADRDRVWLNGFLKGWLVGAATAGLAWLIWGVMR